MLRGSLDTHSNFSGRSTVSGISPMRLPKGAHLQRVPRPLPELEANPRAWADAPAGSQALPWAATHCVFAPCSRWLASQLPLHLPRCQGFQNMGGSVLGSSFGYKAVCTCLLHRHNCSAFRSFPCTLLSFPVAWIVWGLAETSKFLSVFGVGML